MTIDEKTKFEWITARLQELGQASMVPGTSALANAAVQMLTDHVNEVLPRMIPAFQAAQQKLANTLQGTMDVAGPKAWAVLHNRALSAKLPVNPNTERGWLFNFGGKLPCGDCRRFFAAYMQTNPPDFNDYPGWTFGMHNAVNLKMKKPEITVAQAMAIWAPKEGDPSTGAVSNSTK